MYKENDRCNHEEIEFKGIDAAYASVFAPHALYIEALHALKYGPPIGTLNNDVLAKAHYEYLQEIARRCAELSREIGFDLDRRFSIDQEEFSIDFSIPTFEEIERRYIENTAFLTSRGLFASSWETLPHAIAFSVGSFPVPWWLEKLLSLFGIEEEDLQVVAETFVEEIGEDIYEKIKDLLKKAGAKLYEGKYDEARRLVDEACILIQHALDKIVNNLDKFLEKLAKKWAKKLGLEAAKRKAAKIGAKILSKCLPILGWLLFLLELSWLLLKNIAKAIF